MKWAASQTETSLIHLQGTKLCFVLFFLAPFISVLFNVTFFHIQWVRKKLAEIWKNDARSKITQEHGVTSMFQGILGLFWDRILTFHVTYMKLVACVLNPARRSFNMISPKFSNWQPVVICAMTAYGP